MDVDSFLALDSAAQTLKFKSFFAKLDEEAICYKSEKALMLRKIDKLEIENRATNHSDLNQAKKDLLTAKLSLADKDIVFLSCYHLPNQLRHLHWLLPNQPLTLQVAILRLLKILPYMQWYLKDQS